MRRFLQTQIALLFFLDAIFCMSVSLGLMASRGNAADEDTPKEIARLIKDLGSPHFEVREKATHRLAEMEEAKAALREAQKSADAEIRRRAEDILQALERRRALRGLTRAHALGKAGRAVEAADRLVKWGSWDATGQGWDSLTQFARQATDKAAPYFPWVVRAWQDPKFPAGDFQRYAKLVHAEEMYARKIDIEIKLNPRNLEERAANARLGGQRLYRAEEISIRGHQGSPSRYGCIIAASGDIRLPSAYCSLIIAGGDIRMDGLKSYNLVICDGDVELQWPDADKNVIVARGKVTWPKGKRIKCLIRSGHTLLLPDGKIIDLNDGTPDPLAFVKFFELADVGLTAEDLPSPEKSDAKGVLLKEVRKDSLFAKRLRPGDSIIALEDKKTPTTETFRRILRRKLAEDEPTITFTVRRSGKTLDVSIPIKD
ncbi:MAG TPA: hypothetical protein VH575_31170 [Gemmataceae bacterium]|jgi:hypothetical protein